MKILASAFLLLFTFSLHAANSIDYRKVAQEYFDTYKQRDDFEQLLSFYADELAFEDVFYQVKPSNKDQFSSFYDWNKGKFDRLENEHILTLDSLVVDNRQAVAKGSFLKFSYNGKTMGPWSFVIWLEFDQQGKIIKQQDWINYSQQSASKGR